MAKAEKTEVEVVTVEEGVALRLSMAEVRALYSLTMRCGGSPKESPRGLIDGIREAIREATGNSSRWNSDWANPEYRCFMEGGGIIAQDYEAEEEA